MEVRACAVCFRGLMLLHSNHGMHKMHAQLSTASNETTINMQTTDKDAKSQQA